MSLKATPGSTSASSNFIVDEGTHLGILVKVIDLGIQERGKYLGKDLPNAASLGLMFELPEVHVDGQEDKPAVLFKQVVRSANEMSNLFSIAHALLGGSKAVDEKLKDEGIDAASLIGKAGLITVGRTSGDKAKIVSVSSLIKGMSVPKPKTAFMAFDLDHHTEDDLESLPKFVRDIISRRVVADKKLEIEDSDEVQF